MGCVANASDHRRKSIRESRVDDHNRMAVAGKSPRRREPIHNGPASEQHKLSFHVIFKSNFFKNNFCTFNK